MPRRIKFLSQYFYPEAGATSELLSGIAVALRGCGHTVDAVAGPPSYFGAAKTPRQLCHMGVRIRRVWATSLDKNSATGRVLNTVTFVVSALWNILWTPAEAIVIAVTNPPLLPWVCFAGHVVRRHKYVVLIHDVYPDIAVRLGALREGSLIVRLWSYLNRLTLRHAERIVVLGHDMAQVIVGQIGEQRRGRIACIPNWADGGRIQPRCREDHELLASLGILDRFVVQYSGNIGRFHEIETILSTAGRLRDSGFLFLFIGTGAQVSTVEEKAAEWGPESVRLLPFQPRERLGTTLTACDVGLVTLRAGLSGLAVPSKLYGILAAGKAVVVIGPRDCEAARVVMENECGIVVDPGDVAGLVAALQRLKDAPELCARLGRRSRATFEAAYDLPAVAEQWRELVAAVSAGWPQSKGGEA